MGNENSTQTRKLCWIFAVVVVSIYLALARLNIVGRFSGRAISTHLRRLETSRSQLPDVIIYRRSKKTGSSSMLEELLRITKNYNYVPLYHRRERMQDVVRAENLKSHPRRLFVAEHNGITREDIWGRKAVILETVMDGYTQMTSHCRYVLNVQKCDSQLIECLEGPAKRQLLYRWAGRADEDAATFIDFPLSSLHPALSTNILRQIFPKAVANIRHRNFAGSACPELPEIRSAYQRNYRELEKQNRKLRKRMLWQCGYPAASRRDFNISLVEMLDAAEKLEKTQYQKDENLVFGNHNAKRGLSAAHKNLKQAERTWVLNDAGEIVLSSRNGGKI